MANSDDRFHELEQRFLTLRSEHASLCSQQEAAVATRRLLDEELLRRQAKIDTLSLEIGSKNNELLVVSFGYSIVCTVH